MKNRRRRFKQTASLQERLFQFAEHARAKAEHMPAGSEREAMFKRAHNADAAALIDRWITSPDIASHT